MYFQALNICFISLLFYFINHILKVFYNSQMINNIKWLFIRKITYPIVLGYYGTVYTKTQVLDKKSKTLSVYKKQEEQQLSDEISKLGLKQFSVKVHHLLLQKQKSPIVWANIQKELLNRMTPTTDDKLIRSYSKIIYSLSKAKMTSVNYETKISILLPFANPKSFTTLITSLSRIGPFSQQFSYIVEKLYYKRKHQLNPRQKVSINYSLSLNNKKVDTTIVQIIDSLNCLETVTMLRCYDLSDCLTEKILKRVLQKILAVRKQINVLDLSQIINIYLKYGYVPGPLEELINQNYHILKQNINDICLEKIWEFIPNSLNHGKLKVSFVENIIATIEILRKSQNIDENIWKKLHQSFNFIDNIELRVRLQKLY